MKRMKNAELTTSQLVEKFSELALEQHEAVETFQVGRYNRLYERIKLIESELKGREGDQRRALVSLLDAPNIQVRFMTAYALLTIVPERVRVALKSISETGQLPQSVDASYTLDHFEESLEKFRRFEMGDYRIFDS